MATGSGDPAQEAAGSPRLWPRRGTAHQALKTLGLPRGRSKFSFLIRRWGNQVQTLFLHNLFLSLTGFLYEPLGSKFFPKSLGGLPPSQGRGCLICLPLPEWFQQSQWAPRMWPPFLPDLNAEGRARTQRWFLLQELSPAGFGGSHRKPIHLFQMLPQTCFACVGLCTSSIISHPKSPVPTQGCFLPSQTRPL